MELIYVNVKLFMTAVKLYHQLPFELLKRNNEKVLFCSDLFYVSITLRSAYFLTVLLCTKTKMTAVKLQNNSHFYKLFL